jgi:predicted PurR-regulated permease PerM
MSLLSEMNNYFRSDAVLIIAVFVAVVAIVMATIYIVVKVQHLVKRDHGRAKQYEAEIEPWMAEARQAYVHKLELKASKNAD